MTLHLAIQLLTGVLAIASVLAANTGSWKWAAPLLISSHLVLLIYFGVTGQAGFWLFNVGMIAAAGRNWALWRKRTARKREEVKT